jgi:SAM-dependent methyltransferase
MQNASLTSIISENREYWTGRAAGYSEVNLGELATSQREKWSFCLRSEISRQLPDRTPSQIRVLEAGTGPGFFAILLCELGYDVTAVDLTPAMLVEAKKNAGPLASRIRFLEMNAESLDFPDSCFDVVVSRNLTWNLPHPDRAYIEWARALKPGGLLLNFDANWYAYLFDDEAQAAYEQDRINSAAQGVGDQNVGENFDAMEDIARRVPLSDIYRPVWDLELLSSLGLQAEADEQVWKRVWSEQEKLNFSSTPLFLVRARKPSRASAHGYSPAG